MKLYYRENYLGAVKPGKRGVEFQDMSLGDALALEFNFEKTWFCDAWHSVKERDSRGYLCGLFRELNSGALYRAEWEPEDSAWNGCYAQEREKDTVSDEKGEVAMDDEMITRENLSKEYLISILDRAFVDVKLDKDGYIMVRERCNCFVLPNAEYGRIRLLAMFHLADTVTEEAALRCVNDMNQSFAVIRASVREKSMHFTYDILIDGGIAKKNFVLQLRRFCLIPHDAVAEYGKNVID